MRFTVFLVEPPVGVSSLTHVEYRISLAEHIHDWSALPLPSASLELFAVEYPHPGALKRLSYFSEYLIYTADHMVH